MGESDSENQNEISAIVTTEGDVVSKREMAEHAFKQDDDGEEVESRTIKEDDRFQKQDYENLIVPPHNLETLAQLPEINTHHYRAAQTKARDVAGNGWDLVPADGVDDPSEDEKEKLERAFVNPDPENKMSFGEILERMTYDYDVVGNGFIEVRRLSDDNDPVGFTHVPGHTVRRSHEKNGQVYAQKRNTNKSWFKQINAPFDIHKDDGTTAESGSIDPSKRGTELIHFQNYTTRSSWYGLPDSMSALVAILGDREAQMFNVDFFENHGMPSYAVTVSGADLGPDVEKKIKKYFQEEVRENPHSTLIITAESDDPENEIEFQFESLSVDVKDSHFSMYREENRDEVLSAHGVPPYRAAVVIEGKLGQNVAAETTQIYNHSVVKPRQEAIERKFNQYIIREMFGITDWKLKLNRIAAEDEEFKEEKLTKRLQNGVITPNEYRQEIGREPKDDPALDEHYINGRPITGEAGESVTPAVTQSLENIEKFNENLSDLRGSLLHEVKDQRQAATNGSGNGDGS